MITKNANFSSNDNRELLLNGQKQNQALRILFKHKIRGNANMKLTPSEHKIYIVMIKIKIRLSWGRVTGNIKPLLIAFDNFENNKT